MSGSSEGSKSDEVGSVPFRLSNAIGGPSRGWSGEATMTDSSRQASGRAGRSRGSGMHVALPVALPVTLQVTLLVASGNP